jgi:hypothetical protein
LKGVIVMRSAYNRGVAALLACLATAVFAFGPAGCQRVNYPEPTVTKVVGNPGVCEACQKAIESVRSDQLVLLDGVQYVVCDEPCAAALKKSDAEQKER